MALAVFAPQVIFAQYSMNANHATRGHSDLLQAQVLLLNVFPVRTILSKTKLDLHHANLAPTAPSPLGLLIYVSPHALLASSITEYGVVFLVLPGSLNQNQVSRHAEDVPMELLLQGLVLRNAPIVPVGNLRPTLRLISTLSVSSLVMDALTVNPALLPINPAPSFANCVHSEHFLVPMQRLVHHVPLVCSVASF